MQSSEDYHYPADIPVIMVNISTKKTSNRPNSH